MRHGKKINHLGRTSAHRKAMLANMANSLIEHKRIHTTLAKAKELRKYVEPLVTKSKQDNTHSRRVVFSYLQNKDAVSELFREVAPKVADRPGGYTRIIKTGPRMGDNAEMAYIELVDFNELYTKDTKTKKSRRRRGGKKGESTAAPAETAADTTTEEVAAAEVVENEETPETASEAAPEAAAEVEEAPAAEPAEEVVAETAVEVETTEEAAEEAEASNDDATDSEASDAGDEEEKQA